MKISLIFFFPFRIFSIPWLLRDWNSPTLMQILHLPPSRILNPCWVEFFLPSARWVNGFLVSLQPLHCFLVYSLIAFVLSLRLFSFALFFFLRKIAAKYVPFMTRDWKQYDSFRPIFFSFWNQQKKKVTSLREREKDIYFGDH